MKAYLRVEEYSRPKLFWIEFDLYICTDTILLRRSDEPSDYWSSGIYLFHPHYWTSFHVNDQKDHWNETVLVLIRELVLCGELEVLTKFS